MCGLMSDLVMYKQRKSVFWFKYNVGQKSYAPQVRPDQNLNSCLQIKTVHFMSLRSLL